MPKIYSSIVRATTFREILRWIIRNGCTASVLKDKWCSNKKSKLWSFVQLVTSKHRLVFALFNDTKTWRCLAKIRNLFPPKLLWHILKLTMRTIEKSDQLYRLPNPNGLYTAKSGYQWLMYNSNIILDSRAVKMWRSLWSLCIPTHWKLLMWMAFHDAFPTRINRRVTRIARSHTCPRCNKSKETIQHFFRDCWLSKLLWWISPLAISIDANPQVPRTQ